MPLVDAEGRMFGRWNFVDAVVAVLVVGLIPVGYAAYALFRTPAPLLTAVEPAELVDGPNLRVTIRGTNLRPYLRVSFNTTQGVNFLFEDSTKAVVDLHPMPPGTYDVILYDFAQERHRLPGALTIKPSATRLPSSEVHVAGRFINLTAEALSHLKPGLAFDGMGEIVTLGAARPSQPRVFVGGVPLELPSPPMLERPALVKLTCLFKVAQGFPECGTADFLLRKFYVMQLPGPSGANLPFQIDQIRGLEPVQTVRTRVRLSGPSETLALMTVGDKDLDPALNEFALGATVTALDPVSENARTATLDVRVQRLPTGWWDGADTLRASSQFTLKMPKYTVTATVLTIDDRPRP